MTRKQIRAIQEAEKKKDVAVMLKQSEVEGLIEETKRVTNQIAVNGLVAAFAMSLNDEFGFATKRIGRVLESTRKKFEAMLSDHLTHEDVMKWCHENNIEIQ